MVAYLRQRSAGHFVPRADFSQTAPRNSFERSRFPCQPLDSSTEVKEMECKFSYTQGTMFGKPTDAHPMELPLARSHVRRGLYGARSAGILVTALFLQVLPLSVISEMQAHAASTPYPSMAPLDQYLIADQNVEIALARSAAPKSISDRAGSFDPRAPWVRSGG